ncbi:MAG: hypothetical protein EXQ92_03855 [Alphaproteobacteria bacterium]|nr:hypothetical protein [Alphaproteobacteria bacterium]
MILLTRRNLFTTTALAGLGAAALATDLPTRAIEACQATGSHARLQAEAERLLSNTAWAGRNIVSALAQITCPGCGEPFVKT